MKKVNPVKEELLRKIKKARRVLQAILHNNSVLADSTEIACFEMRIEQCRMWLGKMLGCMGEVNSYGEKDGKRKTSTDILPEADSHETKDVPTCIMVADKIEYVELVDRLRGECEKIQKVITDTEIPRNYFVNETQGFYATMTIQECWKNIVEARMWLGSELKRIREESIQST